MVRKHLHTLFSVGAGGHLTDGELLERFIAERDESAFEILFERHGPMVLRVCRSRLADVHGVEDAFQATFLILVQRAGSIHLRGSVASWLFGVANRVASRARVDAARRTKHERNAAKPEAASAEVRDDSDLWRMLRDEVARLPLKYREPVLLCYVEGKTCEEAAARLGRPVGTVKAQLSRARKRLQNRLSHQAGQPSSYASVGLLTMPAPVVPPALATATSRVVMAFSRGQPESLAFASTAARLARGGMRSIVVGKIKMFSAALLVVASFLGAAAFTATSPEGPGSQGQNQADRKEVRSRAREDADGPRDAYGDALPKGAIVRLGSIRYRGQDTVGGVAFVGGELVVVSDHGEINYYDAQSGRLLHSAAVAVQNVRGFALSADRNRLAVTGFSFDPARAATVNHLKILDAATGQQQISLERPQGSDESFALGPDGTIAATVDQSGLVRIWDLATGKVVQSSQISVAGGVPSGLKFSPDSSALAIGGDSSVVLWPWKRNQPVEKVSLGSGKYHSTVTAMAFSPDGSTLVLEAGYAIGTVLIDVVNRKVVGDLGNARDAGRSARAFAFSPDGRRLIVAEDAHYSDGLAVWDLTTRKRINTLRTSFAGATELAFSPDGRTFAAASGWDGTIDVWDIEGGKSLTSVRPGHEAGPSFIEFTNDDSQVVTAGDDGTIRYWDVRTGKALQMSEHHVSGQTGSSFWIRGFAVSPDGRRVASSSLDDTVRLWDAESGKEIYRFPGHGALGGRRALAFSRDGRRLVSWGDDFQVYVWDTATGKAIAEYRLKPSGLQAADADKATPARKSMIDMLGMGLSCLSPDGSRLVLDVGSTYVFDAQTGQELRKFDQRPGMLLGHAISPDNALVLRSRRGPNELIKLADGRRRSQHSKTDFLTLQTLDTDRVLKEITLPEYGAGPVAFSADGARFAAGVAGKAPGVRIFETSTCNELGTVAGLGSAPRSVAFSRNGKLLATGLKNGTVLIWDLAQAAVPMSKPREPSK